MENQNKNQNTGEVLFLPSPATKKSWQKPALKIERPQVSRYQIRKRRLARKAALRKYGTAIAILGLIPALVVLFYSYRLNKEQDAVIKSVLTARAAVEHVKAPETVKDAPVGKYGQILTKLGSMGAEIGKAAEEFGKDRAEAELLTGLMIGIANAESTLGTNFYIDYDAKCHNWWGLKGGNMSRRGDGSSLRCFVDDRAGARTMAKTLKLYYLNEGKNTPKKIVIKYVGATWDEYHDQWVSNVNKYLLN